MDIEKTINSMLEKHNKKHSTNHSIKDIVEYHADGMCAESYPCQHTTNFVFKDGTSSEKFADDGNIIFIIQEYFGKVDRHFEMYRPCRK